MSERGLYMPKWSDIALICVFSIFLFSFGLGNMALTDPDEPFYAQTAKEMLNKGEWLTPRIFGEPQFEKPPLYYWLVIISYKIFGVNEFSARFPSALFGVLGVSGIYFLAKLLFTRRTAIYSSLVMAASVEYAILSRACVTDIVLGVLILYGFLFFLRWDKNPEKRFYGPLSSFMFALAVLTKGPIGLILPSAVILIYLLIADFRKIFKFPFLSSFLAFFAVAAPWYILMMIAHGRAFIDHFFGFQNITRFLTPEHKSGDVLYYYIPILLGGLLPWSIFIPSACYRLYKNDKKNFLNYVFLIGWALVFFVFFSISRTKLPTYIFPMFPAFGIAIGRYIDMNIEEGEFTRYDQLAGLLYVLFIPIAIVIFYAIALKKYPAMVLPILNLSFVAAITQIAALYFIFVKKIRLFFISMIIGTAVLISFASVMLALPVGLYESTKYMVMELEKHRQTGEKVGAETDFQEGTAFYLERDDIVDVHKYDTLTKFLARDERVWCIIKDKNHWELYTDSKKPFDKPSYVIFKLGKKVLVSNKIPPNGEYLKKRTKDDPL